MYNMFFPLAPAEAQQVYSTLYQDDKKSNRPSLEHGPANGGVDAVYSLATAGNQGIGAI